MIPRRRSHLLPLLGGGTFIIAVIVTLIGWAVLQARADAQRIAEVATANLSKILADNLSSAIRLSDLSILAILDEISQHQQAGQWNDQAINAAIARQDARHPELLGFRIFGADGKLRYAVSNVANRNADLSQRAEFQYLRDSPDGALLVSPPLVGVAAKEWIIALARRITNPDGSFGGAVYGPIPIRSLMKAFTAVDIGEHGTFALFHTSFLTAARYPETEEPKSRIGMPILSPVLRGIVASGVPIAQIDYKSLVDGLQRTASVRRIEGQPYYILVGLSPDDYLVEWRRDSARFLLFGGFLVGLVLLGMVILYHRISDWQRATASLAEKTEQLALSNADLERFAYVASHDLQTPLRTIASFTQLLERRYKGRLDADADEFIAFIVDSAKHMARLITDLLDYARVTSQGKALAPMCARRALDEALANLKGAILETGAELLIGDLPEVLADEAQLVSLFQNLVGNALKYRHADRPPCVEIQAAPHSPTQWRISVADNGIGIESQYFDKIFEIFQRLSPNGGTEGTGLGLAVCQRIVHRLGGTIWVESIPGQGSTFFFTLPKASD